MSEMYQRSTDEVLAELGTSVHGLSGKEAAERLARYGQNKLKEAHKITVFQRFLQQIKDPMLLILLAAAGQPYPLSQTPYPARALPRYS